MGDSQQLIMDYPTVSAAGQAYHDVATNIAVVSDQTAPGCVAAALAFPGWATSQAVRDVHAKHTEHLSGTVTAMHGNADSVQTAVVITQAADNATGKDAARIGAEL